MFRTSKSHRKNKLCYDFYRQQIHHHSTTKKPSVIIVVACSGFRSQQATGISQNTQKLFPDTIVDIPESMFDTPDTTFDSSDIIFDTPESIFDSPDTIVDIPESISGTPDTTFDNSDIIFDTPESIFDSPDTIFDSPESIFAASAITFVNKKKRVIFINGSLSELQSQQLIIYSISFFKSNIMKGLTKAIYSMSTVLLYSFANFGWNLYLRYVKSFTAFNANYTQQWGEDQLAAITAAMAMPDRDQRGGAQRGTGKKLNAAAKKSVALWKKLKRYIMNAYPAAEWDTVLQQAGIAHYTKAAALMFSR